MFFAVELHTSGVYILTHRQGLFAPPNRFIRVRQIALREEYTLFRCASDIETVANFTSLDNVMPSHMNKHVPLPKMMVPVGKVEGKPVALQFMGRAGPVGASDLAYAFDDELLRGLDVPFLRDVDVLVEAMVGEDPSLARVAPEMVTRDLA